VKTVVFACVHNAGRSQMAAALFNKLADPAKGRALSAGTSPGERVHPEVVTSCGKRGLTSVTLALGSSGLSSRPEARLLVTWVVGMSVPMCRASACYRRCPRYRGSAGHHRLRSACALIARG
jgi:arsenate reductase